MSFMLSVPNKPCLLSVIMLSVIMLSVVMLSVVMLTVVIVSVVMLSVIMLNVVAPLKPSSPSCVIEMQILVIHARK
jgi:hypothetical protein